jgi:hypothetical protein
MLFAIYLKKSAGAQRAGSTRNATAAGWREIDFRKSATTRFV